MKTPSGPCFAREGVWFFVVRHQEYQILAGGYGHPGSIFSLPRGSLPFLLPVDPHGRKRTGVTKANLI